MIPANRFCAVALLALAAAGSRTLFADAPATAPSTQPDPMADRLTFLTLRLSSVEASINATNNALRIAGYKVAIVVQRAGTYVQGNEIMDRNGGAPVAWDKFYGATARQFEHHDYFDSPRPYPRPPQFDYLYRANNEQIAKANQDIEAVEKNVDTLLARRRALEAEQSALWATIAWESVGNQEIAFRPLYRFRLKPLASGPATNAQTDVLRPAIFFLRTLDKVVADDLEGLSIDQRKSLVDLKDRTQAADVTLRSALSSATLAPELSADDLQAAKMIDETARKLAELSKNISESYDLALEGDAAKDDPRKLTFRAQLQSGLLDYSTTLTDMDRELMKLGTLWKFEGEKGVATPDVLAASPWPPSTTAAAASGAHPADAPAQTPIAVDSPIAGSDAPATVAINGAWVPLKVGARVYGETPTRVWTDVPPTFAGHNISREPTEGRGTGGSLAFTVTSPGTVLIACGAGWLAERTGRRAAMHSDELAKDGWRPVGSLGDNNHTVWTVFARSCKQAETFTFNGGKMATPLLIQ